MRKNNKFILLVVLLMLVSSCSTNTNVNTNNTKIFNDIETIFQEENYIELNSIRFLNDDNTQNNEVDINIIDEMFKKFLNEESVKEPVVSYSRSEFISTRKENLRRFNEEFLIFNLDMYIDNSDYIIDKFSALLDQHKNLENSNIHLIGHILNITNSQFIDSNFETKMQDSYNEIVNKINTELFDFSDDDIVNHLNMMLSFGRYYPMPNVYKYQGILSGLYDLKVKQYFTLEFIYNLNFKNSFGVPILKDKSDLKKFPGFKEYFEIEGKWKQTHSYDPHNFIFKDFKGNYESFIRPYGWKEIYYRNNELYIEDLLDKDSNKIYKLELTGDELKHIYDTYRR